MDGSATIGSALDPGLLDALTLHLAPVVPGAGTPLFTAGALHTLVRRSVTSTSTATPLTVEKALGEAQAQVGDYATACGVGGRTTTRRAGRTPR